MVFRRHCSNLQFHCYVGVPALPVANDLTVLKESKGSQVFLFHTIWVVLKTTSWHQYVIYGCDFPNTHSVPRNGGGDVVAVQLGDINIQRAGQHVRNSVCKLLASFSRPSAFRRRLVHHQLSGLSVAPRRCSGENEGKRELYGCDYRSVKANTIVSLQILLPLYLTVVKYFPASPLVTLRNHSVSPRTSIRPVWFVISLPVAESYQVML